ncbi:integration host factor subunit beta, partial [Methylobacterium sp. WL30]
CEAVVDAIIGRLADAIVAGDRVELRGFGSFTVVETRARMGRNPRSGASVAVEAKAKLVFKTGKDMRDRLNPKATAPRAMTPSTRPSKLSARSACTSSRPATT